MTWISFTNWSDLHLVHYSFVGLENFTNIFTGATGAAMPKLLLWNIAFAGGTTAIGFFLGVGLAVALNKPDMKSRFAYRTFFILPWAIPAALSFFIWRALYTSAAGLAPLNKILNTTIPWITDPFWAKVSVLMANTWTAFPFMMVVALGVLQSIPRDVHEAAELDGAGRISKFRHVTLPMISRAMLPVVIFTFIFHFHNIQPILLITEGEPIAAGQYGAVPGATDTLGSFSYFLAFGRGTHYYALGAAFSVIMFILLMAFATLAIKKSGTLEELERR